MTNNWSYGPIYCSIQTSRILQTKFPGLSQSTKIIELEFNKTYIIGHRDHITPQQSQPPQKKNSKNSKKSKSGSKNSLKIEEEKIEKFERIEYHVTPFDANHVIGSTMYLFETPFGTFFHTGDFRFDDYMLKEYTQLYPDFANKALGSIPKSVHIDELWLDNTYCDPVFKFPKRDKCVEDLIRIIGENKPPCEVFVKTYSLGKEEILSEAAAFFGTKVVVDAQRMEYIRNTRFQVEYFTDDPTEGWIYCLNHKGSKQNYGRQR